MNIFFLTIFLFCAVSFAQGEQNEAEKRKELLGNVNVSRVHSIDKVKGSYKSPKKAMFMSLVLPGSGQIYVGSTQSRYVRGVFYLAEEIALISGLYYHSFYKYDKQVTKYQDFAKKNFSVSTYENVMNSIYSTNQPENLKNLYGSERENYCKAFRGTNPQAYSPCVDNFGKGGGPEDGTQIVDKDAYYRAIANRDFVAGWNDFVWSEGGENAISANLSSGENPPYLKLGDSKNYEEYLSLRKKATGSADKQAIFLGALILNHVVSAIDAALSARAHNNSLYEEKVSFTDNLRLGSDISMGENFKAGASLRLVW